MEAICHRRQVLLWALGGPLLLLCLTPPPSAAQSANPPPRASFGQPIASTAPDAGNATVPNWSAPQLKPGEEVLPISLPAALKLANVRAWDIAIAEEQLRIAAAQLQGAKVLWIPSFIAGAYYAHHDGPIQANDGTVTDSTRSSLTAGIAPLLNVYLTDAIFTPLAAPGGSRPGRECADRDQRYPHRGRGGLFRCSGGPGRFGQH